MQNTLDRVGTGRTGAYILWLTPSGMTFVGDYEHLAEWAMKGTKDAAALCEM